jgi:hypothetical protein
VIEQIRTGPAILECQTLLILSDTKELANIKHWKHTARWIIDRTAYVGPDPDKWFALFVPSSIFKCHFTWTATYILKALVPFVPKTDLVLLDHDATFTTLFENSQLTKLALNLHLPYRFQIKHLGMLTITEPGSNANAGIVWFPRNPLSDSSEPAFRFGLRTQGLLFKLDISEVVNLAVDYLKHKQLLLLSRKRELPPTFAPLPWRPPCNSRDGEQLSPSDNSPEELRKQTALDWNLEFEAAIFNNTPLHHSSATSRDDLIIAWALLGDFMHLHSSLMNSSTPEKAQEVTSRLICNQDPHHSLDGLDLALNKPASRLFFCNLLKLEPFLCPGKSSSCPDTCQATRFTSTQSPSTDGVQTERTKSIT